MLNKNLENTLKSGNIAIIADVDGSLTPPGNHPQLLKYNDILIRAYDATMGAFMFLTNNDARSIDRVAKQITRNVCTAIGYTDASELFNKKVDNPETDFRPIIVSEHATRIRRWEHGRQIIENADNIPALDIENITKNLPRDQKGKLPDGRPIYQAKENTVCFNFTEGDKASKKKLETLAQATIEAQNATGDFEVVTLLDSVEILPKGAHKKDALNFLDKFPAFNDDKFIIMIGDTETDADVARELHASGRGAMIAVGNHVTDGDHVLQRVDTVKDLMKLLDQISVTVETNKKADFDSNPTSRLKHLLPTGQ